jgi:hypothetical protein
MLLDWLQIDLIALRLQIGVNSVFEPKIIDVVFGFIKNQDYHAWHGIGVDR